MMLAAVGLGVATLGLGVVWWLIKHEKHDETKASFQTQMDTKLREASMAHRFNERPDQSFIEGYKYAIKLINGNEFYDYQGRFVAKWLEKHLTQEVKSDRSSDK